MSFIGCIEGLEDAKKELLKELQFSDEEKETLIDYIDNTIDYISNQWNK